MPSYKYELWEDGHVATLIDCFYSLNDIAHCLNIPKSSAYTIIISKLSIEIPFFHQKQFSKKKLFIKKIELD